MRRRPGRPPRTNPIITLFIPTRLSPNTHTHTTPLLYTLFYCLPSGKPAGVMTECLVPDTQVLDVTGILPQVSTHGGSWREGKGKSDN